MAALKYENWMHEHNDILGDRPLTEIVLPGSHDAAVYSLNRPIYNDSSKTQDLTVYNQLRAGSRYLDLRAWWYGGEFWMHHGEAWTDVKLSDVVDQIGKFLDEHPREIVLASLLLQDKKNHDAFKDGRKQGWELVYSRLHKRCLNFTDASGTRQSLPNVTPNSLTKVYKNFLLFTWGDTESWTFKDSAGTEIRVAPWPAHADDGGPIKDMDLKGAYKDRADATPAEILREYTSYKKAGGAWILHTNTPFGGGHSLWHKHEVNTPELTQFFTVGMMGPPRANIVDIDYVGRPVEKDGKKYDLVAAVIESNFK